MRSAAFTTTIPAAAAAAVFTLLSRCRSLAAVKQLHAHLLSRSDRPFPYNHFLSKLLSPPPPLPPPPPPTTRSSSSPPTRPRPPSPTASFSVSSPPRARAPRCASSSACSARGSGPTPTRCPSCSSPPPAARSAHALLEKLGLGAHDHTAHSLVTAYSCLGDTRAARRVFDGIPRRDVVSWNAMMKAYGRAGMAAEVGAMFRAMLDEGAVPPNGVTVAVVLAACREAGDLALGRWVEGWWVGAAGMEVDSLVGYALVGMYEKCGEVAEARRVFDGIRDKDVVAWNAIITG